MYMSRPKGYFERLEYTGFDIKRTVEYGCVTMLYDVDIIQAVTV